LEYSNAGHIDRWDEKHEQLKAFKKKYGHTRVPATKEWMPLHNWLKRNKKRKNRPYQKCIPLTKVQIEKLDELGIDW